MVYALSVGLPILEVPPPVPLPEVDLAGALSPVPHIVPLVFDPVALVYPNILLVYFLLPLPYLGLGILHTVAIKQICLKFTIVSHPFVLEI